MSLTLYVNNDMILRLKGLKDRNGVEITTATVQLVTLVDRAGDTPAGIALPLAMAHVSAGDFEAEIDDAIDVEDDDVLTATVRATLGAGVAEWTDTVLVKTREG